VGRVRGLHGLGGLVRVEVLTDRPEVRFAAGAELHLEGGDAPLTIASAAPVDDGPGWRVAFAEIRDRAAAERLRDQFLEVAVDRDAELQPGEAFWHEVIGAEVRARDGRVLGKVADVYRAGETEVYMVRDGPDGAFDLAAVRSLITEFRPRDGVIVVDEAALDLASSPVEQPARKPRRRHRYSRHGKGRADAPTVGPGSDAEPVADPPAEPPTDPAAADEGA
jgi:16S rRNA processing protein RimM